MQFDACFHFHLCCIINLPRVYKDCRTFNSIEFDLDNGYCNTVLSIDFVVSMCLKSQPIYAGNI